MIRSSLRLADGSLIQKSENLVQQWQDNNSSVLWLDIADEPDESEKQLLKSLGCHSLAIQDAQRTRHPPKVEVFDELVFILYRGIVTVTEDLNIERMQIALFVGENIIITRRKFDSFAISHWWDSDKLAKTLQQPLLLASKLMHYSFGRYLEVILEFEQQLSEIEDRIQNCDDDEDLRYLTQYKSRLRKLRRDFNYHERLANTLLQFVRNSEKYNALEHDVRDVHERAERINSLLAMYYEICGDLIEGYLSLSSHKLNRTMQILTVVTTIFVPLGFLAGIYGMNFDNIPELHYKYGYFILLGSMISIAIGAFTLFKIKRWI